jgi:hypothetical protein
MEDFSQKDERKTDDRIDYILSHWSMCTTNAYFEAAIFAVEANSLKFADVAIIMHSPGYEMNLLKLNFSLNTQRLILLMCAVRM